MSSIKQFRCDPDLERGKATCRLIPFACLTCLKTLKNTLGCKYKWWWSFEIWSKQEVYALESVKGMQWLEGS